MWTTAATATATADRDSGSAENQPAVAQPAAGANPAGALAGRCGGRGAGRGSCRSRGNRAALGVARIGPVEAGALEHYADAVELLAQRALALGAGRQGVVAERLHDLEGVAAVLAGV